MTLQIKNATNKRCELKKQRLEVAFLEKVSIMEVSRLQKGDV